MDSKLSLNSLKSSILKRSGTRSHQYPPDSVCIYDAAYGQNLKRNTLGLFSVGTGSLPYRQLSDNELKEYMLQELDELFDGKASRYYLQHISQNWDKDPFAKGVYLTDKEN